MTDRLALSVDEVAATLGVGRDCIYRSIKAGEIPAVKVGGRVLVPRVWLERLFADAVASSADMGGELSPTGSSRSALDGTRVVSTVPSGHSCGAALHVQPGGSFASGTDVVHSHTGT